MSSEPVPLPSALRDLIESGPLAHLTTINADGSAQVSVIWIGLDGDDVVSSHLGRHVKVRNAERDPRVVLSFEAPRRPGVVMAEHAILHATASVEPSDQAWDLLNDLHKIYVDPTGEFPAPKRPGFVLRYHVTRVGGVGPWVES
ncbi:PPOX class F420-dependent oxidoreductase [Actinoplanes sp. L3-i22]|uniref:PPOX class F420-dependent oxidoreductase n=1 Tax=Actinoplanes sp. L3-i22 TaxID=2836373 RepID=UPI001C859C1C|nr:PPOX class F420-dependent oxidoreductase [Actinoplanes sp. L3-i22]